MRMALIVAMVSAAVVVGMLILRGLVRRFRRLRRLERAAESVAEAMADGRLTAAAGEALLQHLDGLRRACVRWREG
jgi:HAMP domain-containing protein